MARKNLTLTQVRKKEEQKINKRIRSWITRGKTSRWIASKIGVPITRVAGVRSHVTIAERN